MDEKIQFQIQAYLDGSLQGAELVQFQQQLATDQAVAEEVALFQEMEELLGESDVLAFENTIAEVLQTNRSELSQKSPKKIANKEKPLTLPTSEQISASETTATATIRQMQPKPNAFRRVLAIAAGIALIAVVGSVLFLNTTETVSPESLYASTMEFPSDLAGGGGFRSMDTSAVIPDKTQQLQTAWATANNAYKAQQYETALTAINVIEQIDTNFDSEIKGNLLFKKGLILLKLKRTKEAISAFEMVKDGDYTLAAQWKKAIALLLINPKQAKIDLQQISKDTRHPEQENAARLLKQL